MSHHLVVCLNPTLQRTLTFDAVSPGQVNRALSNREDASGKGVNVARVLTELGETSLHLTHCGGASGERFLSLCKADGIAVRAVPADVEVRTCYTLLDEAHHQTTELVESGSAVTAVVERNLREAYREALLQAHTVIISGSKAPGFSGALYPDLVRIARQAGVRVILDVRGTDLLGSLEHGPNLVKINVSEFASTFLDTWLPEGATAPSEVKERMRSLSVRGIQVVLTNGSRPVLVSSGDGIQEVAVEPITPVNTIGCGDAVTAGLATGLHREMSLPGALELALDCARRNAVQVKPGTLGRAHGDKNPL